MIPQCPWCGSTAQVRVYHQEQEQPNPETYYINHYCACGCGTTFVAKEKIVSLGFETIEPVLMEDIVRKMRK